MFIWRCTVLSLRIPHFLLHVKLIFIFNILSLSNIEYNNQNKWGIYIECLCKWLLGILFFSSIWSSESGSWLLVERAKQILLGVERGQQSNIFYHIVKHFSFLYISFHISLHLSLHLFLQLEIIKMYLVSFIQSCKYFNKFWILTKYFESCNINRKYIYMYLLYLFTCSIYIIIILNIW